MYVYGVGTYYLAYIWRVECSSILVDEKINKICMLYMYFHFRQSTVFEELAACFFFSALQDHASSKDVYLLKKKEEPLKVLFHAQLG